MNWKNIVTVYLKELKDTLRDRRSLISIIVIPTFVMPALFFGVGKIAAGSGTSACRGKAILRRVGEDVATLTPHRSGRAGFPHPAPRDGLAT